MKHEIFRQGVAALAMAIQLTVGQALAEDATGPLFAHPTNGRYFTDGSGKAIYLTGSHTWNNLVDMGRDDPPAAFDFDAYLNFLERQNHNFIRLWAWDSVTWDTNAGGQAAVDFVHQVAPLPWARTGSGQALDGKPKFDLEKFDPAYFERLRTRVKAAGQRGIYVSVMLFEGWGLTYGNRNQGAPAGWAWRGHPFHPDNNVNGIMVEQDDDGLSGKVHSLESPAANAIQTAYIRKVVDTLNDLDNVLYEVINEGGQKDWDWWVAETIHEYELTKPNQHPVGITGHGAERLDSMLASPAEWISPGGRDGYGDDPPAWNDNKVSLLDTDHIWGMGGSAAWVWKSFLRGHNPIFMDPYDGVVLGTPGDIRWEPIRRAMGQTHTYANKVELAAMTPQEDLCSTKYCLANPGQEYLVYQPESGAFTVNLAAGTYDYEWFNPTAGSVAQTGSLTASGGNQSFTPPFAESAVLYFKHSP